MLSMLDPLLPFLVTSLTSRHSQVVELSLRIFAQLVQLPLPGTAPWCKSKIWNLVFQVVQVLESFLQDCPYHLEELVLCKILIVPKSFHVCFCVCVGGGGGGGGVNKFGGKYEDS